MQQLTQCHFYFGFLTFVFNHSVWCCWNSFFLKEAFPSFDFLNLLWHLIDMNFKGCSGWNVDLYILNFHVESMPCGPFSVACPHWKYAQCQITFKAKEPTRCLLSADDEMFQSSWNGQENMWGQIERSHAGLMLLFCQSQMKMDCLPRWTAHGSHQGERQACRRTQDSAQLIFWFNIC